MRRSYWIFSLCHLPPRSYSTQHANCESLRLRWKYLEAGVSKVMLQLADGVDMNTVGATPPTLFSSYAQLLTCFLSIVYGCIHVRIPDTHSGGII